MCSPLQWSFSLLQLMLFIKLMRFMSQLCPSGYLRLHLIFQHCSSSYLRLRFIIQLCPSEYFTCESGSMTCIYNAFKCDCSKDCDDGSDETAGYAGCTNVEQCLLENGAGSIK